VISARDRPPRERHSGDHAWVGSTSRLQHHVPKTLIQTPRDRILFRKLDHGIEHTGVTGNGIPAWATYVSLQFRSHMLSLAHANGTARSTRTMIIRVHNYPMKVP
jgi:hypothetical protein